MVKIKTKEVDSFPPVCYYIGCRKIIAFFPIYIEHRKKGDYIMGKYFGTDGFRGEAGVTLTADHAYKVGRFLGWYYNMIRERNGNTDPARIVPAGTAATPFW